MFVVFGSKRVDYRLCRVLAALLVMVAVAGCGLFGRGGRGVGSRPLDSAVGGDPSVTPFKLDVLQESNDGENLSIKGQLTSKISRSSKDALVRLTAVDTSGEQRVSFHKVADLIPGATELQPGKPTQFSLAIPSQGLSNYQVEVLWGKDAAPYLGDQRASMKQPAAPTEYLALRNLEVHRVPDGSCSSPEECLVSFSIKGEFFNSGRSSIKDVVLVAGFAPAMKMDKAQQPLENERRIEVRNISLAPQATKPFRLTLEKLLPASDTVAYQPVVRIVSFDSEGQ
jgi:hypothetical protein